MQDVEEVFREHLRGSSSEFYSDASCSIAKDDGL